ncbi:hypothetical protein [Bradyrhizobium phage ppBeUSDA76-2]|nr:hypothetical protein JEY66_17285 [Bradyrhizobium elkanii USDA 76]WAX24432.1 hypothetical protein [Bradyrhizobium phage ppBeUSDA76-2]
MSILSWLASGPLDRIFKTIDNSVDNQTTREQIKADLAKSYLSSQVAILTGRGWWFPLLFMVPAGLWFAAVCVYSVLWCKGCAYPQTWTIAALPPPLDQWMGAIIGSLFIGKAGGEIISQLKR